MNLQKSVGRGPARQHGRITHPDYSSCSSEPETDLRLEPKQTSPFDAPAPDPHDSLVVVDGVDERISCINAYRRAGWPGTKEGTWLRAGALARLRHVAHALPDDAGIAIYDAWRSEETIRALHRHYYGPGSTLPAGFLADPDDPETVPPHATGGAVDLTLTRQGTALSLGTHFDDFTALAAPDAAVGEPATSLRRVLQKVMATAGFVGASTEWWHFSVGDAAWASASGVDAVPYGRTAPSDI